jgi:hypothetical protein
VVVACMAAFHPKLPFILADTPNLGLEISKEPGALVSSNWGCPCPRYPQRSPPAPPRAPPVHRPHADLASQERSPERLDTAKRLCDPRSNKRGT